jgi:hypothetical protein
MKYSFRSYEPFVHLGGNSVIVNPPRQLVSAQSSPVKVSQTDAPGQANRQIVCKGFNMSYLRNKRASVQSHSVKPRQTSLIVFGLNTLAFSIQPSAFFSSPIPHSTKPSGASRISTA